MRTNKIATFFQKTRKGREDVFIPIKTCKVHWQDKRSYNLTQSNRPLSELNDIEIYVNDVTFNITKGDVVISGTANKSYKSISEIREEFEECFIVQTIDFNQFGTGRLYHQKIGAK